LGIQYNGVRFNFGSTNTSKVNGVNFTIGGYVQRFNGFNYSAMGCGSDYFNGVQGSICFNAVYNKLNGVQFGLVNVVYDNITVKTSILNGIQIGIVNYCNDAQYGIQLGLLNIIKNNPRGLRYIPLVNFHFGKVEPNYSPHKTVAVSEKLIEEKCSFGEIGDFSGKVIEFINGEAVPVANATVEYNEFKKKKRSLKTNSQGEFVFKRIMFGGTEGTGCTVIIKKDGYKTAKHKGLIICESNNNLHLDITNQ